MRRITFEKEAFEQYNEWATSEPPIFRKLMNLIIESSRTPFEGTGKPELLKHSKGYWSRRITQEHRLVYKVTDDAITVVACKYHYGK